MVCYGISGVVNWDLNFTRANRFIDRTDSFSRVVGI